MLIHNFLFIQDFVEQLNIVLKDARIVGIYGLNNDELFLDFGNNGHIRFEFVNGNCFYAYFPEGYTPNKDAKPRFRKLWDTGLKKVKVNGKDRSFFFTFKEGSTLAIVLYGRRSNILFYEPLQDLPKEVFRYEVISDKEKSLNELLQNRVFEIKEIVPISKIPFIPKEIASLFSTKEFTSNDELNFFIESIIPTISWKLNKEEKPPVFIVSNSESKEDVLQILRDYYILNLSFYRFNDHKNTLLKTANNELKKKTAALAASKIRLHELENQRAPKEIADLVMAYLHMFENRKDEAIVEDFYRGGQTLIKLPKDTSAIKYAEKLYKKSGGVKKEIELTKTKIEYLQNQIQKLQIESEQIDNTLHIKELKTFDKKKNVEKAIEQLPYNEFVVDQCTIRIGKNAKANDEMLRNYSHKNDLWLHAKGHAGSHVIIKRDNRQEPIPEGVILTAASWAAWFSKGKNHDTLPVIVTERKYVRKNKNLKPGQVIVDKEKVVLVKPQKPE